MYQTYYLKSKNIFRWKAVLLKCFILSQDAINLQVMVILYLIELRMILYSKKEVSFQSAAKVLWRVFTEIRGSVSQRPNPVTLRL